MRELGPTTALRLVSNRMHASFFEQYKRYQADRKKAALTWESIAYKHKVGEFPQFFEILKKRSFHFIPLDLEDKSDEALLLSKADEYAHSCFDILGSRNQCLITMPWHADFRLQHQKPDADYLFDKNIFYKDFVILHGLTDRLTKDIKVPWELSRFQHSAALGVAYKKTGNALYSQAFSTQVSDWIDENPYLLGPNWVCPMDVGIRAFNWVVAFHYFKNAPDITDAFWKKYTASLYNHFVYLEHNWEIGSTTSNHYLSDLIGYFSLTWLFADLPGMKKKRDWCYRQLLVEWEKQVFDEGADYEGSTAYHRLVTEIFYYFSLLCQESDLALPGHFNTKLQHMMEFLQWCTPENGQLVTLGDDDSGKLINGIPSVVMNGIASEAVSGEKHFKEFGLSVIKTKEWHVTLRHHTYLKQQPSGHFHNDMGSITVALKGVSVIVDPGSYVYTPSAIWRNRFRSVEAHNTFFVKGQEPVSFDEVSLFTLPLEERVTSQPFISEHVLYGPTARREIFFDQEDNHLMVHDAWLGLGSRDIETLWNFTLAPHIVPYPQGNEWHLFYKDEIIAKLSSPQLTFAVQSGWYAPHYGTKVACKRLVAQRTMTGERVDINISGT